VRVRILKRPTGDAAGISLNRFEPGFVYEVGTHMGNLLLAERFAEPVDDDRPAMLVPLADDSAPRSILIIDDDQQTRTMLTTLLTLQGYATQSAADGRDGLDKLRKHNPALILLDLRMPAMDGFAFRTAQAKLPKPFCDVPVVVISGVEGADREVRRLNAAEFVRKPIDDDALLRVIRSHFDLPAANGHR
jgi:CheY-like chemotaxis protein